MDNRNGNPTKVSALTHKVMAYPGMLDLCFTHVKGGLMLLIGAEVKISIEQYNKMLQMLREVVILGKYFPKAEDAIPVELREADKMEFASLYNEIAKLSKEEAA